MTKQLTIDNLIVEVTRKCNMKCAHCLRGPAENIDITNEIIRKALKDVVQVNSLVFTGGEPTLNVKAIKYTFNYMHKNGKEISSFWMATNGKVYSQALVNLLMEEYANCVQYNDEFYGGLAVSLGDGYHEEVDKKNLIKYKALKFYSEEKEGDITSVIDEGFANQNGIGDRSIDSRDSLDVDDWDEDRIIVNSMIYINSKGDVLLDCDYSYERQEEEKIGNVLETPLIDIILNYIKNHEDQD